VSDIYGLFCDYTSELLADRGAGGRVGLQYL